MRRTGAVFWCFVGPYYGCTGGKRGGGSLNARPLRGPWLSQSASNLLAFVDASNLVVGGGKAG